MLPLLLHLFILIVLLLTRLLRSRLRCNWTVYNRPHVPSGRQRYVQPTPMFLRVEAPVKEWDVENGGVEEGKRMGTLRGAFREAIWKGEREREMERRFLGGWKGKGVGV